MQLKMHYVRERVNGKDISLTYVSTKAQRADLLTKNLPRPAFELFRSQLLNPLSLVPSTTCMGGVLTVVTVPLLLTLYTHTLNDICSAV